MRGYEELIEIARQEFADIIFQVEIRPEKVRLHVIDGSFIDVWFSRKLPGRFAYHWERRHVEGRVYRYDNRPHQAYRHMKSYPRHFHHGAAVVESCFSEEPVEAFRQFLTMARSIIEE